MLKRKQDRHGLPEENTGGNVTALFNEERHGFLKQDNTRINDFVILWSQRRDMIRASEEAFMTVIAEVKERVLGLTAKAAMR